MTKTDQEILDFLERTSEPRLSTPNPCGEIDLGPNGTGVCNLDADQRLDAENTRGPSFLEGVVKPILRDKLLKDAQKLMAERGGSLPGSFAHLAAPLNPGRRLYMGVTDPSEFIETIIPVPELEAAAIQPILPEGQLYVNTEGPVRSMGCDVEAGTTLEHSLKETERHFKKFPEGKTSFVMDSLGGDNEV